MAQFTPRNLVTDTAFWCFENDARVEFVARGMDGRYKLLLEVASDVDAISKQAVVFLKKFILLDGKFDLQSVEVLAAPDDDGASVVMRFGFTGANDPDEYAYAYFDVLFAIGDPELVRFAPMKFTVGCH